MTDQAERWAIEKIVNWLSPGSAPYRKDKAIDDLMQLIAEAHKGYVPEGDLVEARYMGAQDFVNWLLAHDESSFSQERAWYKIKPSLITQYQAELAKGLKQIRTNTGKLYAQADVDRAVLEARLEELNNVEYKLPSVTSRYIKARIAKLTPPHNPTQPDKHLHVLPDEMEDIPKESYGSVKPFVCTVCGTACTLTITKNGNTVISESAQSQEVKHDS